MAEAKKQLRIKTGSVSRLRKEISLYTDEVTKQQSQLDSLKEQGADPHDIKHAENLLSESAMMIPDTRTRLDTAAAELRKLLEDAPDAVRDSEEASKAGTTLEEAQEFLEQEA